MLRGHPESYVVDRLPFHIAVLRLISANGIVQIIKNRVPTVGAAWEHCVIRHANDRDEQIGWEDTFFCQDTALEENVVPAVACLIWICPKFIATENVKIDRLDGIVNM